MNVTDYIYWPNNISVGAGAVKTIPDWIKKVSTGKNVIFITDPGLFSLQKTKDTIQLIADADYEVDVFYDLEANPSIQSVNKLVALMQEKKPVALVYYGGGSATDCGKVANVVYTHGGTVQDYSSANGGLEKIKDNTLLPSISVATTAGTGTETSASAVITDTEKHQKFSVYSPYLLPTVSMLDPEVTVSLPAKLTAFTGMDALVHNIEAYSSDVPFAPIRGVALYGVKVINENLRTAYTEPSNLEARENMLVGSTMGAIAFNLIGLGVVHGVAHQLSSVAGLPHGLACAMMLPVCMRWNLPSCMQEYADIAQAMGADISGLSKREAAEKAIDLVELMMDDLNIPKHLREVGVTDEMIDDMVEKAYVDRNSLNNPRKDSPAPYVISKDSLRKLYLAAM